MKLPTLYKLDSKGKTREWNMYVQEEHFWTESGIVGMKMNVGKPTFCKGKNIGRANETTDEEQAELEAKAKWEKKLKDGYTTEILEVTTKKFFEPMLARKYEDLKDKIVFADGVFSQPKLDGIRCVIKMEGSTLIARTRKGRLIETIPHILSELSGHFHFNPEDVLDGELYNHELKHDFNKITSLVRKQKPIKKERQTDKAFAKKQNEFKDALAESEEKVQFWNYDVSSEDIFSKRFADKTTTLKGSIIRVETTKVNSFEELDELYRQYLEEGYEGQMVRLDKPYENKRSKSLMKRKEFQDAEFEVLEIASGEGNWTGAAKSFTVKCPETGNVFNSNIRGNFDYLTNLLTEKENYIGKLATIEFFEYTPDGIPRFPYIKSFRDYE